MYLDIAVCAVLLLGTLLGVFKGFSKTLRKSFILCATIAMMLCGVCAEALTTSSMGVSISEGITQGLTNVGGDFFCKPLIYNAQEEAYYIHTEQGLILLTEALKTMPTNPLVKLVSLFSPLFLKGQSGVSIIDVAVPQITRVLLLLISYVILFVVIRIIFIFINKLVQKILEKMSILKGVDMLLGGVVAFVKSILFVLIALAIVGFVANMEFSGVELLVEQIENATIGKWLIENNMLFDIIASIFRR